MKKSIVLLLSLLLIMSALQFPVSADVRYSSGDSDGTIKKEGENDNSVDLSLERDKQTGGSNGGSSSSGSGSGSGDKKPFPKPSDYEDRDPPKTFDAVIEDPDGTIHEETILAREVTELIATTYNYQLQENVEFNSVLQHYNWYFNNLSTGLSYSKEKLGYAITETFTAGKWKVSSIPFYKWDYGSRTRTVTYKTYRSGTAYFRTDGVVSTDWTDEYTTTSYGPWTYHKEGSTSGEKTNLTRVFNFTVSVLDEGKPIDIPSSTVQEGKIEREVNVDVHLVK